MASTSNLATMLLNTLTYAQDFARKTGSPFQTAGFTPECRVYNMKDDVGEFVQSFLNMHNSQGKTIRMESIR